MPKPNQNESRQEFITRCMGDPEANSSFPDEGQRYAFCVSQWNDSGKAKTGQEFAVKAVEAGNGIAIKDIDTTGRVVTGFYNTFNYFDSQADVLLPGSISKSITERGPNSNAIAKIKHALHHDMTLLPGQIKVLEERKIGNIEGLYFETKMANTTLGMDTLKNYLEGIYDNHSIGFRYLQLDYVDASMTMEWEKLLNQLVNPQDAVKVGYAYPVKEINLFEGSTVAFGANALTPYLGVKSGNTEAMKLGLFERLEKLNKTLKSGTQSDEMMVTFEYQVRQIKQMIAELTDLLPSPRGTFEKKPPIKEEKGLDFGNLCANFKL